MKKVLIMLFLIAMVLVSATRSRLMGFLAPNYVIDDESNIIYFPNQIVNYANTAQINDIFNGYWSYNGGFNLKLNNNMYLGFYFNKPDYPVAYDIFQYEPTNTDTHGFVFNFIDVGGNNRTTNNLYPFNLVNLIFSMKLNENFLVGFLFNYSYMSTKYNNDNISNPLANNDEKDSGSGDISDIDMKFNVTLKQFAMFSLFDLGIEFGIPSYKYDYLYQIYNNNQWYDYRHLLLETKGANYFGLWLNMKTDMVNMFVNFISASLDHNWKDDYDTNLDKTLDTSDGEVTDQGMSQLIFSLNKVLQRKNYLLYFDLSFSSFSVKWNSQEKDYLNNAQVTEEYNYKYGSNLIYLRSGIEYYMKKWLTLRGGLTLYWDLSYQNTVNDPNWGGGGINAYNNEKEVYSYPYYIDSLIGVSFKLKKFDIDLVLDPTQLADIYLLTGHNGNVILSGSVIYRW